MAERNTSPRLSRPEIPPLYALTPNRESVDLEGCVASLIRGGARWIQIREKWPSDRDLARSIEEILRESPPGVRIFVNDRIDLAVGLGAGGVHLGDRDLPPEEAVSIRGDRQNPIIGVSTHSVEEAVRFAAIEGVDYVAIGPIFASPTKMAREDPLGLSAVEKVRAAIDVPVIAIGGIDRSNIASVIRAGADSAAVISALYGEGRIEDNVRDLIDQVGG